MMTLTIPANQRLAIQIASGDRLDVRRFKVEERISSLFSIVVTVVSSNHSIDFDRAVGQHAEFRLGDGAHERTWTGIVSDLQQTAVPESAQGLSTYEIKIVPTLWLATQRRNYRMFQQMTHPDIVKKLLFEWGIEPDVALKATYKKRKYRVQYGESDYAFMSRMLEEAGIAFYFREVDGKTKLVLIDQPHANDARRPIAFRDNPTEASFEHVTGVRLGQRVRPGRYTIRDHDYRNPSAADLAQTATVTNVDVEARLERYHYAPGAFLCGTDKGDTTPHADDKGKTRTDSSEGATLVKNRLDAKRASAKTCDFETNAHDLAPGVVICLLDHPHADLEPHARWLVVGSTLSGTHDGKWAHACEARSAKTPFRPPLATPRPRAMGVESATVVGREGEEIHTDEFGRVRVHFHWDRESRKDDDSSCWIHVSQPWSGGGFGGINLPRVGQEVLVEFLGGDPDRPIIIGRVYTNLQKVPYPLPQHKTQSGWRSNSTNKTGGYNEVMFEDAAGSELFRVHAERDHLEVVKHDSTSNVGGDRKESVTGQQRIEVGKSRILKVWHRLVQIVRGDVHMESALGTTTIKARKLIRIQSNEDIIIQVNNTGIRILNGGIIIDGPVVHINASKG